MPCSDRFRIAFVNPCIGKSCEIFLCSFFGLCQNMRLFHPRVQNPNVPHFITAQIAHFEKIFQNYSYMGRVQKNYATLPNKYFLSHAVQTY